MYEYISDNNVMPPNQSGFCTRDSCINQLLLITHDTYYSFDQRSETRAKILDILKAFDKFGTNDAIMVFRVTYCLFCRFLTNRKQKVVLNGLDSSWTDLKQVLLKGPF